MFNARLPVHLGLYFLWIIKRPAKYTHRVLVSNRNPKEGIDHSGLPHTRCYEGGDLVEEAAFALFVIETNKAAWHFIS